ncbi:MAG TPA: hypothetical protein VF407_03870 [Polyangiaceae bacterium]
MRALPFLGLTTVFAGVALASAVFASPEPAPSSAPAPKTTRVILMPAPPPPVPTASGNANAADGGTPFVLTKTAPDPTALVSAKQWVYDLRYDKGSIYLLGVHPLDLPSPQATPRVMGRFAIELFEGPTLVERVRFDFPMMAGTGIERPDAGTRRTYEDRQRVDFEEKMVTRIGVIFPQTRRGNRMDLVDRATGTRLKLPWPPVGPDGEANASPTAKSPSNDGGH